MVWCGRQTGLLVRRGGQTGPKVWCGSWTGLIVWCGSWCGCWWHCLYTGRWRRRQLGWWRCRVCRTPPTCDFTPPSSSYFLVDDLMIKDYIIEHQDDTQLSAINYLHRRKGLCFNLCLFAHLFAWFRWNFWRPKEQSNQLRSRCRNVF